MTSLRLIDGSISDKEIRLLAKWRRKVQPLWKDDFKVTFKGTKKWINDIIKSPRRMLFFIVSDGKLIGHIGYDIRSRNSIYLDCAIRGGGPKKGQMKEAVFMLLTMARKLKFKNCYGRIVPSNIHSINYFEKIGFVRKGTAGNLVKIKYEFK